jgi:hypothetical protein
MHVDVAGSKLHFKPDTAADEAASMALWPIDASRINAHTMQDIFQPGVQEPTYCLVLHITGAQAVSLELAGNINDRNKLAQSLVQLRSLQASTPAGFDRDARSTGKRCCNIKCNKALGLEVATVPCGRAGKLPH